MNFDPKWVEEKEAKQRNAMTRVETITAVDHKDTTTNSEKSTSETLTLAMPDQKSAPSSMINEKMNEDCDDQERMKLPNATNVVGSTSLGAYTITLHSIDEADILVLKRG